MIKSKLVKCEESCADACEGRYGDEYLMCVAECVKLCMMTDKD